MRIRYYVLTKGQQFEVFREDISKGTSSIRNRAMDLARSLARLETRFTAASTEVLVEDEAGHLASVLRFDPVSDAAPRGGLLNVGDERVLLR
jgi:ATP-dependent exoDNAse (exonuclease V) alpha subunit